MTEEEYTLSVLCTYPLEILKKRRAELRGEKFVLERDMSVLNAAGEGTLYEAIHRYHDPKYPQYKQKRIQLLQEKLDRDAI